MRGSFALGGKGSGRAAQPQDLRELLGTAFVESSTVLVEEDLTGWKEIEYEVVRDGLTYSNIFPAFPDLEFYDYTKILGRKINHIENYSLTFSAADGNDADVAKAMQQGYNIATVFGIKKTLPMPETYMGIPVFNGDESDLRFLDPHGVIVGLYAKGKAKKDTTGFVKYPTVKLLKAA